MKSNSRYLISANCLALAISLPAFTEELEGVPNFGGKDSPQGQVYESKQTTSSSRVRQLDGVFNAINNAKKEISDNYGLTIYGHYSVIGQSYNKVDDGKPDHAVSGDLQFGMKWSLPIDLDNDYATISVIANNRHSFTDYASGSFGAFGYYGISATQFGDFDGKFEIITAAYSQSFNHKNSGLLIGSFDPNDYMSVLGYTSPQTTFSNLNILLDTSVALGDTSFGIGGGHWFNDSTYVIAGINDANGYAGDDFAFFERGSEFLKWVHVGYTPTKNERYNKNIHLLAWHTDKRKDYNGAAGQVGQDAVYGVAFASTWTYENGFSPFFRIGLSEGQHDFFNKSLSTGFTYKVNDYNDSCGMAANWGKFDDKGVRTKDSQLTTEMYYRFQVSSNIAITPSVQYIVDPAYSSSVNNMVISSIRARINF